MATRIINEQLTKAFRCQVAIGANRVVVAGTIDGDVTLPSGADVGKIVGVSLRAGAIGEYIDVALASSIVPCIASAAIAFGDKVSIAAAAGTIKTAAPGAGTNTNLVGQAYGVALAANDEISVLLTLGTLQG